MTMSFNGTSGLTFPDASTQATAATGFGFKNRIINGNGAVDQRNAGAAVNLSAAAAVYPVDRFPTYLTAVASGTLTAQKSGGLQGGFVLARTSGSYAGKIITTQVIETINCVDLAGQSVALSLTVQAGSAWLGGNLTVKVYTGSGTDQGFTSLTLNTWTGQASQTAITITPTTTETTYSGTVTIPAGTTEIAYWVETSNFTGTGSANDFVILKKFQLEKGSTATSFDYRPYGTELVLCQRYYQNIMNFSGNFYSTNAVAMSCFLPVQMRTAPTVSVISGTSITINVAGTSNQTIATPSFSANSALYLSASGGTSSTSTIGVQVNTISGAIQATAEL